MRPTSTLCNYTAYTKTVYLVIALTSVLLLNALNLSPWPRGGIPPLVVGADAVRFCVYSWNFPAVQVARSAVLYLNHTRADLTINHTLSFEVFVINSTIYDPATQTFTFDQESDAVAQPAQRRLPLLSDTPHHLPSTRSKGLDCDGPLKPSTSTPPTYLANTTVAASTELGFYSSFCDFAVGMGFSGPSSVLSRYVTHIPTMGYLETSLAFTDAEEHPLFSRISPTDKSSVTVISDFMKLMGWAGCYSVVDAAITSTCWSSDPAVIAVSKATRRVAPIVLITSGDDYGTSVASELRRLLTSDTFGNGSASVGSGETYLSWEVPTLNEIVLPTTPLSATLDRVSMIPSIVKQNPDSNVIFLGFSMSQEVAIRFYQIMLASKLHETHIIIGVDAACLFPIPFLICTFFVYDEAVVKDFAEEPQFGINGANVSSVADFPPGGPSPPKTFIPYIPNTLSIPALFLDAVGATMNATVQLAREYLGCPTDPATGMVVPDNNRCTPAAIHAAFNDPTDDGQAFAFGSPSASPLPRYSGTKYHNTTAMNEIMMRLRSATLTKAASVKPTASGFKAPLRVVNGSRNSFPFEIVQRSATGTGITTIFSLSSAEPLALEATSDSESLMIGVRDRAAARARLTLLGNNVSALLEQASSANKTTLAKLFSLQTYPETAQSAPVPLDTMFVYMLALGIPVLVLLFVCGALFMGYLHYSDPNLYAMKESRLATVVAVRIDSLEALSNSLPREVASALLRYTAVVRHLVQIYHGYELENSQAERFQVLFCDPEDAIMFSFALQEALVDDAYQLPSRRATRQLAERTVLGSAIRRPDRVGVGEMAAVLGDELAALLLIRLNGVSSVELRVEVANSTLYGCEEVSSKQFNEARPRASFLKGRLAVCNLLRDVADAAAKRPQIKKGDEHATPHPQQQLPPLWPSSVATRINAFYRSRTVLCSDAMGPTSIEVATTAAPTEHTGGSDLLNSSSSEREATDSFMYTSEESFSVSGDSSDENPQLENKSRRPVRHVASRGNLGVSMSPSLRRQAPTSADVAAIFLPIGSENLPRSYDQLWNGLRASCLIHAGQLRFERAQDEMDTHTYTGEVLAQANWLSRSLEGGQVGVTAEFRNVLERSVLRTTIVQRLFCRRRFVSAYFALKNIFRLCYDASRDTFISAGLSAQDPPCHSGKRAYISTSGRFSPAPRPTCKEVVDMESYPLFDYPISSHRHPHNVIAAQQHSRPDGRAGDSADQLGRPELMNEASGGLLSPRVGTERGGPRRDILRHEQQVVDVVRWSPLTVGSAAVYTGVVVNTGDFVVLNTHFMHSPLKQRVFNNLTPEHVIPTSFFEKVRLKALAHSRQRFQSSSAFAALSDRIAAMPSPSSCELSQVDSPEDARATVFPSIHREAVDRQASSLRCGLPPMAFPRSHQDPLSVAGPSIPFPTMSLVAGSELSSIGQMPSPKAMNPLVVFSQRELPSVDNVLSQVADSKEPRQPPTTFEADLRRSKRAPSEQFRQGSGRAVSVQLRDGAPDIVEGDTDVIQDMVLQEYIHFKDGSRELLGEPIGDHRGPYLLKTPRTH